MSSYITNGAGPTEADINPRWRLKFMHLLIMEALMQFGLYTMNPIVSSYAVFLGATVAFAGFVAGMDKVASLIVRPISGLISDMLSKKWLLVLSCVLFTAASVGCALATSPVVIGVCRALQGVGFAFKSAIVVSLAALVVPREHVGSGVGSLGMAFTIACALGPMAGDFLSNHFSFVVSFSLAATLFIIALVLAITFKAPKTAEAHNTDEAGEKVPFFKQLREAMRLDRMFYLPKLPLTCVIAFTQMAQGTNMILIILVGNLYNIQGISAYFLVYAIVTFFSKPFAGHMSDKYGCQATVIPGALMAAAAMLLLAVHFTFVTAMIAGLLMGLGHGSIYSTIQSECVRGVPAEHVGRGANMHYLGSDIGMGFGPMISGFFLDHFGSTGAYLYAMCAVLLGLTIFIILLKMGKVGKRD